MLQCRRWQVGLLSPQLSQGRCGLSPRGRRRPHARGSAGRSDLSTGGQDAFRAERFAVHMSAHVLNKDGKLVKGRQGQVPLIQFGPARERGPREAVQPAALCSGGSVTPDAGANEQMASRLGSIAAFRRVQIRSATLNNGQRGSAGQQFYALKLTLLAFPRHGPLTTSAGVEVACLTSHPITVRGRSKVHYAPNPAAAVRRRNQARPSTSSAGTRKGTSQSPRRLDRRRRRRWAGHGRGLACLRDSSTCLHTSDTARTAGARGCCEARRARAAAAAAAVAARHVHRRARAASWTSAASSEPATVAPRHRQQQRQRPYNSNCFLFRIPDRPRLRCFE